MAETYAPFDGGSTAQAVWTLFARWWLQTGVIKGGLGTDCAVTAPGGAMSVNVGIGQAWIQGFFYQNDASKAITITTANASLARIDLIVLHLDMTAKTITAQVLTGTASGSPVAPALTQTSTVWEIALAQIAVGAGVTQITSGNVTDVRGYASGVIPTSLPSGTKLNGSTIWTQANDGTGSGLDADLLQGTAGSSYALISGGANLQQNTLKATSVIVYGGGNYAIIASAGNGAINTDGGAFKTDGSGGLTLAKLLFPTGSNITAFSFFSGTGDGTFSHGLGKTPLIVLPICNVASSTQSMGISAMGSTTVAIKTGAGLAWQALAVG